jgi:hypothetical protein
MEDLENEIWKDVVGFEGAYKVSNLGRVKSLPRTSPYPGSANGRREVGKMLKLTLCEDGYARVPLSNGTNDQKKYRVHRLVAIAFIPNPNNYPNINHVNSDRKDNNISNLEWCTQAQNNLHAYRYGFKRPVKARLGVRGVPTKASRSVAQFDLAGNFIRIWACHSQVKRDMDIAASSVSGCCMGRLKTAGGFVWKFEDELALKADK